MKTNLFHLILFLLLTPLLWRGAGGEANAQVNLVPNPSFEDTLACPINPGGIGASPHLSCKNWYTPNTASPDYMNACAPHLIGGNMNVPNNYPPFGWQYARTGNAYVLVGWYNDTWNEYVQVELDSMLISQHRYCVEFYCNKVNRMRTSSKNIGSYFSSIPFTSTTPNLMNATPQLYDTTIITDNVNWVKISGEFIASGGEQYFTIGNFYAMSLTDTINNNLLPCCGCGYYIDDVSVIDCTGSGLGTKEEREWQGQSAIYPMPATDKITIDIFGIREHLVAYDVYIKSVNIFNSLGQVLLELKTLPQPRPGETVIDISTLAQGIYFAEIITDKKVTIYQKIVKQ